MVPVTSRVRSSIAASVPASVAWAKTSNDRISTMRYRRRIRPCTSASTPSLYHDPGRLRVGDADFDLLSGSRLSLGRRWFSANLSASSRPPVGIVRVVPADHRQSRPSSGARFERLTGRVAFHGRVQFLQSLREFILVDQLMPRGIGPDRCAVQHAFSAAVSPSAMACRIARACMSKTGCDNRSRKAYRPIGSAESPDRAIARHRCLAHRVPIPRRQTALRGLVQDHLQHEIRVVGQDPSPDHCLQAGSIQTVDEAR